MAQLNTSTLPRVKAAALRDLLLDDSSAASTAVIDVRDSDHIGGHIRGSLHVPTSSHDYRMPELVRTLADKQTVVFHCMLSQQRGPSSALRYARERERLLEQKEDRSGGAGGEQNNGFQRIMVLERGFGEWQQLYGEDQRLTEDYDKKLWEDGFD